MTPTIKLPWIEQLKEEGQILRLEKEITDLRWHIKLKAEHEITPHDPELSRKALDFIEARLEELGVLFNELEQMKAAKSNKGEK